MDLRTHAFGMVTFDALSKKTLNLETKVFKNTFFPSTE